MCRIFFILFLVVLGGAFSEARAAEGEIFSLWPLIDYRHAPETDYTSVHILGPLINYEEKGGEREFGLRPLYFRAADDKGKRYSEYLYPVATKRTEPGQSFWQGLHLLEKDVGASPERDNEFMLFPFIFSGETAEQGEYFAFFPFGGKIYDKFGRDEIHFTLFPLYSRTRKKERVTTNVLWPCLPGCGVPTKPAGNSGRCSVSATRKGSTASGFTSGPSCFAMTGA